MVCPTDRLESILHARFEGYKYFYTSLGNAQVEDKNAIGQLTALIESQGIQEVTFVLAEDNPILMDALGPQQLLDLRGLSTFYQSIFEQKKGIVRSWKMCHQYPMVLSYHLNERIKHLRKGLQSVLPVPPKVNGKLYSRHYDGFRPIHPEPACINPNTLN